MLNPARLSLFFVLTAALSSAFAETPLETVNAIIERLHPKGVTGLFKNGYEGEDELGTICKLNIDRKYKSPDGQSGKIITAIDSGPEGKVIEVEVVGNTKVVSALNQDDYAAFYVMNPVSGGQYWNYPVEIQVKDGAPTSYSITEDAPGSFRLHRECTNLHPNHEKNNNRPKDGVWG